MKEFFPRTVLKTLSIGGVILIWCEHPAALAQEMATGALPVSPKVLEAIDKAAAIPGAAVGEPKISMRGRFPTPRHQGHQQSCTAFATGYALKTFLERTYHGWTQQSEPYLFSPAFLYNPFARGDGKRGIFVQDALTYLEGGGCATLKTMPYDENDAGTQPSDDARREAYKYRIEKWDTIVVKKIPEVKKFLVTENPVVIVAFVDTANYGEWARNAKGVTDHYLTEGPKPTSSERTGCHAMVAIGYDDDKQAFEIMNSWGPEWNDQGFGWIAYSFWSEWVNEGYVARNRKDAPLAAGAGVSARDLKWLPAGPEGLNNGNWGYSKEVKLDEVKLTSEKKLPAEIRYQLQSVVATKEN